MSVEMKWEKSPRPDKLASKCNLKQKIVLASSVDPFYHRNTDIDICKICGHYYYTSNTISWRDFRFLRKRVIFNAEISDTEKCAEPVVQGLKTIFK